MSTPSSEFYREAELVNGIVPFSKSTLRRLIAAQSFPAPRRIAPRVIAWPRADIEAWVSQFSQAPLKQGG